MCIFIWKGVSAQQMIKDSYQDTSLCDKMKHMFNNKCHLYQGKKAHYYEISEHHE